MGKGKKLSLLPLPPAPPRACMQCNLHMNDKQLGGSFQSVQNCLFLALKALIQSPWGPRCSFQLTLGQTPALTFVVIAWGTSLPPVGTIACPSSAQSAQVLGHRIPCVRTWSMPGPPWLLTEPPLWSCPACPLP